MSPTSDPISADLRRAIRAAGGVSHELQDRLLSLTKAARRMSPAVWLDRARHVIEHFTPTLEQTLRGALLSSYLRAVRGVVRDLPADLQAATGAPPVVPPDLPRFPLVGPGEPEPRRPVRFPMIEAATRDLMNRNLVTRPEFDALENDAKRAAFTVARISSARTLDTIRNALADDVALGGTLRQFRGRVAEALQSSPLSKHHLENVYRTNIGAAYSAGQVDILRQKLVGMAFPYVRWIAVRDRRVRPDHYAMMFAGLDGTAIYRADDPSLLRAWPPASYQCRCHCSPITLRMAAQLGVREAMHWLETGTPPFRPTWVDSVPIIIPSGWVSTWGRGIRAAA